MSSVMLYVGSSCILIMVFAAICNQFNIEEKYITLVVPPIFCYVLPYILARLQKDILDSGIKPVKWLGVSPEASWIFTLAALGVFISMTGQFNDDIIGTMLVCMLLMRLLDHICDKAEPQYVGSTVFLKITSFLFPFVLFAIIIFSELTVAETKAILAAGSYLFTLTGISLIISGELDRQIHKPK